MCGHSARSMHGECSVAGGAVLRGMGPLCLGMHLVLLVAYTVLSARMSAASSRCRAYRASWMAAAGLPFCRLFDTFRCLRVNTRYLHVYGWQQGEHGWG
jgi:hypothetical protein